MKYNEKPVPFSILLRDAHGMLMDRQRQEADLIYHICKLDHEERGAIILAYRNLFLSDKDEE